MSQALTPHMTFLRRRVLAVLLVALVVAGALVATTSANQTAVRAHIARDGSIVVSGYDGGAPLAP